jgi:hypothetical protein
VSEGAKFGASTDPVELWKQWYDATFGTWANLMGDSKGAYTDPYELYRRWLDNLRDAREQTEGDPAEIANPYESWQQWTEATTETRRRTAETWTRMARLAAPRWMEMAQELQKQMLDGGNLPADPMDLYTRWYNATSGPMSELADDILRDEAFLEYSGRLLDSYAIFDSAFGRAAEEYFGNLRLPTSSDTDRIAGLVVALDDKVDRTEETLEEALEEGSKETAGAVEALEQRLERVEGRLEQLDRLESKLDRLLAAQETADDGDDQ